MNFIVEIDTTRTQNGAVGLYSLDAKNRADAGSRLNDALELFGYAPLGYGKNYHTDNVILDPTDLHYKEAIVNLLAHYSYDNYIAIDKSTGAWDIINREDCSGNVGLDDVMGFECIYNDDGEISKIYIDGLYLELD